jgi:hypothetical protein
MPLSDALAPILLCYFAFIFVLVAFQAMGMPVLLQNAPSPPTVPTGAPDIVTYLGYVFGYIPYFFTIMLISTASSLLGAVIFIPFTLILILEILHLIRGG